MISKTKNQGKNEERTAEYHEKWTPERTLKALVTKEDPLIFDVGANNGSSVHDFKAWWPRSNIHCFEPQKECLHDLLSARAAYEDIGSIKINPVAAGSTPSKNEKFYTHDVNSGISGFHKINFHSKDSININGLTNEVSLHNYEDGLNKGREVEVIRLDDYINSVDSSLLIDLLKIDTQGFEPEVLDGLGEKLGNVNVVLTELMFYDFYERSLSFSDIEKFLLKYNFSLYDISHISKNPMNGRTDWIDVIYINNRIRCKLHQ